MKIRGPFMIIHVEKKNTNCRELPVNYSNIIYDYSCIFMLIRVEKIFMLIHVENSTNLEHFRCRDVLEVLPVVR